MSLLYALTQDILDSLAEAIYTVDKDFRINSFNHAAEKITGYRVRRYLENSVKTFIVQSVV